MATLAALGLQIETGDVERGERALTKLDVAAQKVEAAKDRLAAASSRYQAVQARENASDSALRAAKASVTNASAALSAAQQRSTTLNNAAASAALANANANNALAAATRAAAINQRMLFPQLLQIGQSVPLAFQAPLAFMQQFAFQSADIAQIYAGRGGVTAAISDSASMVGRFAARLGPVAVAAGVAALAMRGLQNDINAVSGASVGMGHLATAAAHELAASVMTVAAPAVDRLGYAFNRTSELVLGGIKLLGNSIVNSMVFAYDTVIAYWNHWPSAIGDLFVSGVNNAVNAISDLVLKAVQGINNFSAAANQFLPGALQLGEIAPPRILRGVDNPYAGGQVALEAALDTAYAKFQSTPFSDYLERVGQGAIELARAAAEAGDGVGSIGRAATQAGQPMDLLGRSFNAANDNMRSWTSAVSGAMNAFNNTLERTGSFFDAAKAAGTSFLQSISQQLMDMASRGLVQAAFGGMGGLGGGGGLFGGLFASIPGFAAGGMHTGGLRVVGERGPEIEATGPARYFSAPQTQRMLSGANNNQPRAVNLNLNMNINGSVSQAELAQATQTVLQVARQEMSGIALNTVTQTNRREGGLGL